MYYIIIQKFKFLKSKELINIVTLTLKCTRRNVLIMFNDLYNFYLSNCSVEILEVIKNKITFIVISISYF